MKQHWVADRAHKYWPYGVHNCSGTDPQPGYHAEQAHGYRTGDDILAFWNTHHVVLAFLGDDNSCFERCDEAYFPDKPCYCNTACLQYENCCFDYMALCARKFPTSIDVTFGIRSVRNTPYPMLRTHYTEDLYLFQIWHDAVLKGWQT